MAYRLVATLEGQELRFSLSPGEAILGSHPDCALRLPHATVSRQHAVVSVDSDGVTVRDLRSRNGLRVGAGKVREVRLEPGVQLFVGAVPVVLEMIPDDDVEAAVLLREPSGRHPALRGVGNPEDSTCGSGPGEDFVRQRLPFLLARLNQGCGPTAFAQLLGEALYSTLPCLALEIRSGREGERGLLFQACRNGAGFPESRTLSAGSGQLEVTVDFPNPRVAATYAWLADTAAQLLALAESRGEVREARQPAEVGLVAPPEPEPPTVVPELKKIYVDAARVARGSVSVLILGESGTGKEVLARYLHRASPREGQPFLSLNCASLPQDLLESELFGIERGVATGVDERAGKFELASGGTLLLDEIGDMALETQAKILRVLQSGEVYRLGASRPRQVDVRVVAATNRDIRAMLASGGFRSDLYHRIATWVVELPPLRHRRADIANLAAYFLAREASRRGIMVRGISRAALEKLECFSWPGNIRQLENEMARVVLFLDYGELLDTGRLSEEIRSTRVDRGGTTLAEVLERVERDEIILALGRAGGDVERSAQALGVSRATLYRRMKALGVEPKG